MYELSHQTCNLIFQGKTVKKISMIALELSASMVEPVLMESIITNVTVFKAMKVLTATIQQMNVKESIVKMEANVLMDTMNISVSANMDLQV